MKFDVVVGNPPYQENTVGNHPLWTRFVALAKDMCAQDGYIALITPRSWLGKQSNRSNNYDVFLQTQLEHVELFDQKSSPFDVGSTISWYVIKNTQITKPTTIVQHINGIRQSPLEMLFDEQQVMLPSVLTETSLSLNAKLAIGPRLEFVKSYEFHNEKIKKKGLVSNTQDDTFIYPHYVSHRILRYTSVMFSQHATWKVMIPSTSTINNCVIANECGHGEDMYCLYVDNKEQAELATAVLWSSLFQYIGKMYRGGRNLISAFRQQVFPFVDITRSWTDEELYTHFNLTTEEIALIEETIK